MIQNKERSISPSLGLLLLGVLVHQIRKEGLETRDNVRERRSVLGSVLPAVLGQSGERFRKTFGDLWALSVHDQAIDLCCSGKKKKERESNEWACLMTTKRGTNA